MPGDIATPVVRNVDLGHGNYLLELTAQEMARATEPGQFFMIGIPGSEILLRRPFSVCGLPGTFEDGPADSLQVLYRVLGRGTALLASLKAGAVVSVLGPLGHGFSLPDARTARPVFVAGGIGSAPFPALCASLAKAGFRAEMLYGARTRGDLPLLDWFASHCTSVAVTTDDGSSGRKALVTAPLEEMLAEPSDRSTLHLYACGPTPMLKAVGALARRYEVRCDLSLEAPMACGFGVCLGCVVPVRAGSGTGYERVCVEGPIFPAERIAW
jgi:dihydroorotate dehydrogenase electron transfer subunit